MRIIISDSSCLIDLQKASLLEAFVCLPYDVCVPDVIFESELLSFTENEKQTLLDLGLSVLELPGDGLLAVQNLRREQPALSVNDCFACVLSQRHTGSVLLTGDAHLRAVSEHRGVEVHGIFWCLDEIYSYQTTTVNNILNALLLFDGDAMVRLPNALLSKYIRKYKELL